MSFIRHLVIVLIIPVFAGAATLRGTVKDPAGQPLAGVSIVVDELHRTTSDSEGAFVVDVADGSRWIRITRAGFESELQRLPASGESVEVLLHPALEEAIVVSGIRAEDETPVTKATLDRTEIGEKYYGQDVPLLLRDTPSVHAYAESGVGGSGYQYLTLRGISSSRLNFTLDGVPLADAEDMGTYFADFPDLARSLESVQVQRGVGTSTFGSPSYGGSVNMESIDLSPKALLDVAVGGGSFGSRQATVAYQTGFLPGGFALYSRLSYNESDGFRDHSGIEQRNLFVSAAKRSDTSQIRLTGFTAHEASDLSFYAVDEATLRDDLRAAANSPVDKDRFGYDLANVQYLRALSDRTTMTASAYYQRGYGWYQLGSPEIIDRYGLDGRLLGSLLSVSHDRGLLHVSYGLHVNQFEREHTHDRAAVRDYSNAGTKREINTFAKVSRDHGSWHWYGDAQLRRADFRYSGSVRVQPVAWTFFSPKVGVRRSVSSGSIYASAGMTAREPARLDMFAGEDNASIPYDLRAVKPERVVDVELGAEYRRSSLELAANLYAMEFQNEIAATGELSQMGLPLRRNVDRSYRRGLELDLRWRPTDRIRLETDVNVSRNRIREWTQHYYTAEGGTAPVVHRDVHPLLTPSLILHQAVVYTPSSRLSFGASGRYVSKSYLDNTDHEDFITPAFFTLDLRGSTMLPRGLRLSVNVNNVLNNDRVYGSGYAFRFIDIDGTLAGTPYFYPQATRNVAVMLDFRL